MIGSTRTLRVWARTKPTDLRLGYDGLFGLVQRELRRDPLSGDAYLFVNQRRTSSKALIWDGTGLCLYCKRLAKSRFAALWTAADGEPLRLTQTELALFLEGADLAHRLPISPEEYRAK